MEGFAYFPAIIYRDERPDLIEVASSACAKHFNNVPEEQKVWPLIQTAHVGNDPALRNVADYFLLSAVDILKGQGYAVDRYDFYISGMWAQEIKRGAGTDVHIHKNSQICGWFFLETPEGGSYPIYHDTRMNKGMVELDAAPSDEITNATPAIHFNNILPGTVMFGNSWMRHQLTGSNTDTPTRCIHFIVSHKERQCSIC